jgi:hypothetical protein
MASVGLQLHRYDAVYGGADVSMPEQFDADSSGAIGLAGVTSCEP